jgi:hypothetical protein
VLKVREDHQAVSAHRDAIEPLLTTGPRRAEPNGAAGDFGLGSVSTPRR